jgi:hypothetical protein
MNKIAAFLIVVVLIARGAMFIYDHNKSKIQQMVSPEKPASEEIITSPEEPDSSTVMNVDRSGTVTFILTGNNEIYYYTGAFKNTVQKTDEDKVAKLIEKYKEITNPDKLMFIIKSAQGSTYNNTISLLQAMAVNEIPASHYDEAKTTEAEMKVINIYKGK